MHGVGQDRQPAGRGGRPLQPDLGAADRRGPQGWGRVRGILRGLDDQTACGLRVARRVLRPALVVAGVTRLTHHDYHRRLVSDRVKLQESSQQAR